MDERPIREATVTMSSYPSMDQAPIHNLGTILTIEELRRATFDMGPFKAPGEDGFPACFFQKNWSLVKKKISEFFNQVWHNPSLIQTVNNTLLVLIPKINKPKFITQFRPIPLCNVVYKILTKAIANRLKPLMDDLISPYQTSFVPRRNIQHNIIIAKEMIHSMHKMRGTKKFMAIKIDLEKAYDRINWKFLVSCLRECQFPQSIIDLVYACMSSASFKVLWNGSMTDSFCPSRDIRQGDPLSPTFLCLVWISSLICLWMS